MSFINKWYLKARVIRNLKYSLGKMNKLRQANIKERGRNELHTGMEIAPFTLFLG